MSKRMVVPDSVYDLADEYAQANDTNKKEALRQILLTEGYDV